jgi:hypothetical protein
MEFSERDDERRIAGGRSAVLLRQIAPIILNDLTPP